MLIDLTELPTGPTYEDRYRGYLDVFERVSCAPVQERVIVLHPPWSWVPLLWYMSCECVEPRTEFEHCGVVMRALSGYLGLHGYLARLAKPFDRTLIEVLCGFRPECVDALWKVDVQWKTERVRVRADEPRRNEFIVTNNGSFSRPEVLDYIEQFELEYEPMKRKVLLVPCAADKPYPAPLHSMCLSLLPKDFYLMNVTGVLGLIPQDLWPVMPHYDSGIPNRWRVFEMVRRYFKKFPHVRVLVYCDFYNEAICAGLHDVGQVAEFVLPVKFYPDYLNLMDNQFVHALRVHLMSDTPHV